MRRFLRKVIWGMALLSMAASCSVDDYESGDGEHSYLVADFSIAHSGQSKQLLNAMTDDGDSLVFDSPLECSWAVTPDSSYRALVYYSREYGAGTRVRGIAAHQVLVLRIPTEQPSEMHADPVSMESAWVSAGARYLNLGLYVKTGKSSGSNAKQTLGVVRDTVVTLDNGTKEHRLRLFHNQNGVPEYYSSRVYATIPTGDIPAGDIVRLEVCTYEGVVVRYFNY